MAWWRMAGNMTGRVGRVFVDIEGEVGWMGGHGKTVS